MSKQEILLTIDNLKTILQELETADESQIRAKVNYYELRNERQKAIEKLMDWAYNVIMTNPRYEHYRILAYKFKYYKLYPEELNSLIDEALLLDLAFDPNIMFYRSSYLII